ncbi:hypothetical protein ABZ359_37115 [Streptomyces sp. NPDC005968]|uniref:hypothetical protein n=1 Tax=Streptomyces sp. NPDC005968 TaxID=3154574 RepID=UPI0033EB3839
MAGIPQGADAGGAEPEPGVASDVRPGLAVIRLHLHPRVTTPSVSHHSAATTAARATA